MLTGGLANVMSLSVIRESVKCSWSGFPSLEPGESWKSLFGKERQLCILAAEVH